MLNSFDSLLSNSRIRGSNPPLLCGRGHEIAVRHWVWESLFVCNSVLNQSKQGKGRTISSLSSLVANALAFEASSSSLCAATRL